MKFPKIAKLNTEEKFRSHLDQASIEMPFEATLESGPESPLGNSLEINGKTIGNRFCILPMEGWDGTTDGKPSELTRRRWKNFGRSGAKLIWGGEAVAVRHDGRANPNQLMISEANLGDLVSLRMELVAEHEHLFSNSDDLSIGLQLTHSGRFARPNSHHTIEPRTAYAHPILDERFNVNPKSALLTDDELKRLIDDFALAARLAAKAGFDWVDVKHCHGYLGHELLSGYDRAGEFGGSFENRTRFLRDIVSAINATTPDLGIGVRVSVFDFAPFRAGENNVGQSTAESTYEYAWGGDKSGTGIDLSEPNQLMQLIKELGISSVCTTAGSPYYCPHVVRPAAFPPSDGYSPPEDPLVGVARHINTTAKLKSMHPEIAFVGSGYSYLQDWLPNVGQAVLRNQMVDSIGLGRMVLSYPEMPADVLAGTPLKRKRICRTFSDCTTAARNGMVSGCFPLDDFYKQRPEYPALKEIKSKMKS